MSLCIQIINMCIQVLYFKRNCNGDFETEFIWYDKCEQIPKYTDKKSEIHKLFWGAKNLLIYQW